jgi:hypothetical protein
MASTPNAVSAAARYAFAGGRFELKWAGHFKQRIYNYDIHSAYPYFATMLPNLARGTWRQTRKYEPDKFAVYRIRYESTIPDAFTLYPLFRRLSNAGVAWPYRVTGWYWAPEAELIRNDKDATILDGWVFDEEDPTDRPFAWLSEYYTHRQRLKNNKQASEYTFKLIINSVYGRLAQRVGWDRKNGSAPHTHQLEWAGYITSACRAAVYRAGLAAGDGLISIDTDGIYTLKPIESLDIGDDLGQWELAEYDDGVFWQSGVYCLHTGEGWVKGKSRGIPKGTYTPEELLERVKTREPLKLKKNKFIGYRQADNDQWENRNKWVVDRPALVFGGSGKRSHLGRFGGCNDQCHDDIHALGALQFVYGPEGDPQSQVHYLPWLDNGKEMTNAKENGYFVLNQEDPDSEEIGWLKENQISSPNHSVSNRLKLTATRSSASAVERGTKPLKKLASLFSRRTG